MKGIHLPPNRNNSQIVKIHSQLLKICRTTQTISIKHGTKHSCVKGFQVCLNEGLWGNSKLGKIHQQHMKNILQSHWTNFNQIWHKACRSFKIKDKAPFQIETLGK